MSDRFHLYLPGVIAPPVVVEAATPAGALRAYARPRAIRYEIIEQGPDRAVGIDPFGDRTPAVRASTEGKGEVESVYGPADPSTPLSHRS